MSASGPDRWTRLVELYYLLGTPLFLVADWLFGINVRVAFLDQWPAGRAAYYAVCLAAGLVVARRPDLASIVGLAESGTSIGLLVLSVMVWYARALDAAGSESTAFEVVSPESLVNLVVVAGMLALSYTVQRAQAASRRGRR